MPALHSIKVPVDDRGTVVDQMFNIIVLAEKRNASINSGVVFLKKIVDFI